MNFKSKNYRKAVFLWLGIFALFFLFGNLSLFASEIDEMSLADILNLEVSIASKKLESTYDAPGIISVISKQEISGFAAQNLGDILTRVVGAIHLSPDVFVDQSLVIRGQETTPYNNHVLILMNGRPVRDPISGGMNGSVYTGFPIESIERIEIIRGPGSVLYGSCAYSGVINIVTSTPQAEGLNGQVGSGFHTYRGSSQNTDLLYKKDDLNIHLSAQHLEDDGPTYSFTDYEDVYGEHNFYRETYGLMSNVTWKGFNFNFLVADFVPYSIDGSEYWTIKFDYDNSHTTYFGDLGYTLPLGDRHSFDFNVTYNKHRWHQTTFEIEDEDTESPYYMQVTSKTEDFTDGNSILCEFAFKSNPVDPMHIILGGGYEKNEWNGGRLHNNDLYSNFLYAQMDYKMFDMLKAIGGLQYNKIEGIDSNTSPRFGLVANFNENFGAKLLYSEAFRKGYPLETSFAVIVFRGNLELEPEEIKTYEAQLFYHNTKLDTSLTYYVSEFENRITRRRYDDPESRPPFYLKYLNEGTWDFWGLEWEGKYNMNENILLTGSLSYQENGSSDDVNGDGKDDVTLHPRFMGKAGVLYMESDYSVGIFNSFYGEPDDIEKEYGTAHINGKPEANNLLSMKVAFDLFKALKVEGKKGLWVSLEGFNLLDEDVYYPDYPNKGVNSLYPLRGGRTWQFEAKYKF